MGTDVYLEWNNKTKEEENRQTEACLTIAGGDVGYLRATVHMQNESAVLRLLFPPKYWHERSSDEYDFKANYKMLEQVGLKYILSSASGNDLPVSDEQQTQLVFTQQSAHAISQALRTVEQASNGSIGICNGEIHGLSEAVEWLNSLFRFFQLGIAKQARGLKPYPYISW